LFSDVIAIQRYEIQHNWFTGSNICYRELGSGQVDTTQSPSLGDPMGPMCLLVCPDNNEVTFDLDI